VAEGQYNLPSGKPAARVTLTPELLRVIRKIESGDNPNAVTGSYKGLYQLSEDEFKRLGGRGSIFDPNENTRIATLKLQQEADQVAARLGRPLTPGEIYLVHQQGTGGSYEHITNPTRPAWQSMHATGEGRSKGEGWARQAIWGNVPDSDKARYGSVDNLTSGDFAKMWSDRIARGGGSDGSATLVKDVAAGYGGVGSDAAASARATDAAAAASAPAETASVPAPAEKSKDYGGIIGDTLQQMGVDMLKNANAQNAATRAPAAVTPQVPMPQAPVPTVDPKMAEMQRQKLAMAMQRLNSGRLG